MRPIDTGCLENSAVFFYTSGEQAKQTFFYPLCVGHYYCTKEYLVQRNNYDSFLLMYIKKGEGYLEIDKKKYSFHAEDAVLLDCYKPHLYTTTKDSEILWVHFDGSTSRNYYEMLISGCGPILSMWDPISFEKDLNRLFIMISRGTSVNDALCSYYIVKVLTDLLLHNNKMQSAEAEKTATAMEEIISYINNNIKSRLSLEELANRAGLSPFYFTRLFKKETGYTPHEFIILSRINIAKFYLKSTTYTIKEICFNSGFTSESSFCSTFRKVCHMTPSEYRDNITLS